MSREDAFSYLAQGPFCLVALDCATGRAIQSNHLFTQRLGPLYKFAQYAFWEAAATSSTNDANRDKFRQAIQSVMNGTETNVTVDQVEMVTLCGAAGLPKKCFFDWTVGQGSDGTILLFGNICRASLSSSSTTSCTSNSNETTRARTYAHKFPESEFVDFFQNAPIALHWLSDNGIVLWANQTELDVLGYTAEEYIGQPIMKFCPDEEELVLEIFKQLGSGNSIKDVPVRFRTKDGRIVHLLIDSNVKYDTTTTTGEDKQQGKKFGHTRCFIRDDTQRKIREAHTQTLLQETKRSLQMLDNFMSRSIHHMRTPLHMMQNTCELVTELLTKTTTTTTSTTTTETAATAVADHTLIQESLTLLRQAERQIGQAVHLADDLVQLGRLDQGAELELDKSWIDVVSFGEQLHSHIVSTVGPLVLDIQGGAGPAQIHSDAFVLRRVLQSLLEHSIGENKRDAVKLQIGYEHGLCTFAIILHGKEFDALSSSSTDDFVSSKLPPIFQRYHQQFIPEGNVDLETATSLRKEMERHVNSFKDNSIGIGLSLAYFLAQGLGSELRYLSQPNGTVKFWFSLPKEAALDGGDKSKVLLAKRLNETVAKPVIKVEKGVGAEKVIDTGRSSPTGPCMVPPTQSVAVSKASPAPMGSLKLKEEAPLQFDVSKDTIASQGLSSMCPPRVLVVEDTDLCAKLLKKSLQKLNCAAVCVENGRLAVDTLRKATPGEFNLVLMDLRMPVMDGFEATKILKQELGLSIPIVALTAETTASIEAECAAVGFDEFRSKPLKRDHLKEVLLRHTSYHVI